MQVKGRVEVLAKLQEGGLGQLLKCKDEANQVFVAKFPKDDSYESQRLIDDESRRFQRHQGQYVVKYLGPVSTHSGRRGFAMELMDGDLASLIHQKGRMSARVTLGYLSTAVRGLEEVHASGRDAFHGDLKTANILHKAGVAKLADFGLARGGQGQTTMFGGHSGGTPGYMPPEGRASARGDIYSLGAVAFALLVGREPQPGEVLGIQMKGEPGLEQLVNQMLSPNAALRPDITQVRKRIDELLAEQFSVPAVVGGVALAVVATLGLGWLLSREG